MALPISGDVYKQIGRSAAGAVSVVGLVEEARTFEGRPLLYFGQRYGTFLPLD